jgi:hypothetical protein
VQGFVVSYLLYLLRPPNFGVDQSRRKYEPAGKTLVLTAHAGADAFHGGAEVVGGDVEALELVLYCSLQVKMLSQNKLQRSCQGFCMPLRMPLL